MQLAEGVMTQMQTLITQFLTLFIFILFYFIKIIKNENKKRIN
jgi:preprotein translocase subunit YajC